jgi:hypothetical protein
MMCLSSFALRLRSRYAQGERKTIRAEPVEARTCFAYTSLSLRHLFQQQLHDLIGSHIFRLSLKVEQTAVT